MKISFFCMGKLLINKSHQRMLNKKNKLNRTQVSKVLLSGRRVHTSLFTLNCFFEKDAITGFSVIVPKKLKKNAVERIKIKRRIYSVLEEFVKENAKVVKCAIILKKDILGLDKSEIKNSINTINSSILK